MKTQTINSFIHFVEYTESLQNLGKKIVLFRGQSTDKPLLPSIARTNPGFDSTIVEKEMLDDFERRSYLLINKTITSEWDLLVYAQHFGLKTRLLDWTSNPLVALWFACESAKLIRDNSYVYIFEGDDTLLIDLKKDDSPFTSSKTRILRPVLNSDRILAQSGWFTAHKYSKKNKKFVKLETNPEIKNLITQLKIPARIHDEIIKKLAVFGINNRTMYPDIHGLCNHLNWSYRSKLNPIKI